MARGIKDTYKMINLSKIADGQTIIKLSDKLSTVIYDCKFVRLYTRLVKIGLDTHSAYLVCDTLFDRIFDKENKK